MDFERGGLDEEAVEIRLEFPADAMTLWMPVVPRGPNRWLLRESAFPSQEPAWRGDVVETEPTPDGHRFLRVVERSPLRAWERGLSRAVAKSAKLEALKARIAAEGGEWEQIFGGIFIAHLPPESPLDVDAEIAAIQRAVGAAPRRETARKGWRFWR